MHCLCGENALFVTVYSEALWVLSQTGRSALKMPDQSMTSSSQLLPVTDQPLIVTWRCRAFGCRSCETSCLPAWRLCQLSSPWQHGEEAPRAADVPAGKRRSRKFKGQVSVLIDEDCSHITGDSIWISNERSADNLTLIPICQCKLKVI